MREHRAARSAHPKVRRPRTCRSAGELNGAEATEPLVSCLCVYDGRVCIGHLILRGRSGVEAYDCDDVSIGTFPDQSSAARALSLGRVP